MIDFKRLRLDVEEISSLYLTFLISMIGFRCVTNTRAILLHVLIYLVVFWEVPRLCSHFLNCLFYQ